MLLEGVSVRAVSRLTGLKLGTILGLMVQAGEQCKQFLLQSVRKEYFTDIQIDEQWGFGHAASDRRERGVLGDTGRALDRARCRRPDDLRTEAAFAPSPVLTDA